MNSAPGTFRTTSILIVLLISGYYFKYFQINTVAQVIATALVTVFVSFFLFYARIKSHKMRTVILISGVVVMFSAWAFTYHNLNTKKFSGLTGHWYSAEEETDLRINSDSVIFKIDGLESVTRFKPKIEGDQMLLKDFNSDVSRQYQYVLSDNNELLTLIIYSDSLWFKKID